MDRPTDGETDKQTEQQTERLTDQPTDQPTDKQARVGYIYYTFSKSTPFLSKAFDVFRAIEVYMG